VLTDESCLEKSTEADSNDITECKHEPTIGTLGFSGVSNIVPVMYTV